MMSERKLGIAIIGLGGAVGTTMVAGIELLSKERSARKVCRLPIWMKI